MAVNRAQTIDDAQVEAKELRTHRMSIRVVMHQYKKLKRVADAEGRTVSDVLRQLIGEFLRAHDGILSEPKGD